MIDYNRKMGFGKKNNDKFRREILFSKKIPFLLWFVLVFPIQGKKLL